MMDLLKKVYAPSTLWRRRKSPSFHARPAVGWAYRMNGVRRRVQSHIAEQLEMERTVRYEDVEHMLPPSLRRDYKPDKYYNAPTMANMKAFIEAGIDVPEDDDVLSQPALAAMGEPVVLS
jgi:hypothetical protein